MHKFVMRTCFFPSIRLFTKMLQIGEFVTSQICGCCIIRDFVLMNRNVSTGNVDTSNAAYMSQKEQNYLWLPFSYLIKMQLVFIEFKKLAKCRICNIRLQNLIYFFKSITIC